MTLPELFLFAVENNVPIFEGNKLTDEFQALLKSHNLTFAIGGEFYDVLCDNFDVVNFETDRHPFIEIEKTVVEINGHFIQFTYSVFDIDDAYLIKMQAITFVQPKQITETIYEEIK